MTETQEQMDFVRWLNYHHPDVLFWHTPNGGKREISTAHKLSKMGVRRGVPDLFFPQLKLFIEMKSPKGSLSKDQKILKQQLEKDYTYIVAKGFVDAVKSFSLFINDVENQTNNQMI